MPNQTHDVSDGVLHVIQITDTHFYAEPAADLLGVVTRDSFRRTLDLIQSRTPSPDLILATGDLVHDGSPTGYRALHALLEPLGPPVYCLPGNHDLTPELQQGLNTGRVTTPDHAIHGRWGFVFLDTNLPGSNGGHLNARPLAQLEDSLQSLGDRHVMICLHHQPVPVGSRWLDSMRIDNADALFERIKPFPNVRCLLWGHVHQEFDQQLEGLRLLACPSTCVQFVPGSENFALDDTLPGYRWLRLHPDGGIETGVERITELPQGPDPRAHGY